MRRKIERWIEISDLYILEVTDILLAVMLAQVVTVSLRSLFSPLPA
jgi:hypothetical protein